MTAISLPTTPGIVTAIIRYLDWGGTQTGVLGGASQRIERLGSRHAMDVELPPMDAATAQAWIQRLKRGRSQMVRMRVPQPGFTPSAPGAVSTIWTGWVGGVTSIQIFTTNAAYPYKEGQLFSVIHGSRSYLYSIDADSTTPASSVGTVSITPMTRTALSHDDVVELTNPIIEGFPEGDETKWTVDAAAHYGLAFTVVEAE